MAKKKEKETIFKNKVGRPTNEIKKKRKMLVASTSLAVVALVGVGSFLAINTTKPITSKLEGASVASDLGTFNKDKADINGDGKIDRNDLIVLKEYFFEIYPYKSLKELTDYNNDGKNDSLDLLIQHQYGGLDDNVIEEDVHKCEDETLHRDTILRSRVCNFEYLQYRKYYPLTKIAQDYMYDSSRPLGPNNTLRYNYYWSERLLHKLFESFNDKYTNSKLTLNGDINNDGDVDKKDYTLLVNYLNKNQPVKSLTLYPYKSFNIAKSTPLETYNGWLLEPCSLYKDTGVNKKTGDYWGKTQGLNIYARYKERSCFIPIKLGDLGKYSKMKIYYQYGSDKRNMKSSFSFYLSDWKKLTTKNVTSTATKDGVMSWSSTKTITVNLDTEYKGDKLESAYDEINNLNVVVDHGSDTKANTFAVKIVKIVLE